MTRVANIPGTFSVLENVKHCRGEPEQADMSLMGDVIHQVNHPPTCTSIYHSQVGILLAGLLICGIWHIAGYVTMLIAIFQNPQVANSSPEIAKYHICSRGSYTCMD